MTSYLFFVEYDQGLHCFLAVLFTGTNDGKQKQLRLFLYYPSDLNGGSARWRNPGMAG